MYKLLFLIVLVWALLEDDELIKLSREQSYDSNRLKLLEYYKFPMTDAPSLEEFLKTFTYDRHKIDAFTRVIIQPSSIKAHLIVLKSLTYDSSRREVLRKCYIKNIDKKLDNITSIIKTISIDIDETIKILEKCYPKAMKDYRKNIHTDKVETDDNSIENAIISGVSYEVNSDGKLIKNPGSIYLPSNGKIPDKYLADGWKIKADVGAKIGYYTVFDSRGSTFARAKYDKQNNIIYLAGVRLAGLKINGKSMNIDLMYKDDVMIYDAWTRLKKFFPDINLNTVFTDEYYNKMRGLDM